MTSAPTIKRRDKSKRVVCADCGDTIKFRKEIVRGEDGRPYHLLCAGFVHHEKLEPCPECFMIQPCLCTGV